MPRAGAGTGTSSSGSGGFTNPWGGSGGGGVFSPDSGVSAPDTHSIGTANLDVTTPSGFVRTLGAGVEQGSNVIDDLGKALFAEKGSIFGGIPVLGGAGRLAGDIFKPLYEVPGKVAAGVGGAAETIGVNSHRELDPMFDASPDAPGKQAALKQIAADPSRAEHFKYEYLKGVAQQGPSLLPEFQVPEGSLADSLGKIMGLLSVPVRAVERGFAGLKRVQGGDRLDQIDAIAAGGIATGPFGGGFLAGPRQLTSVEQVAYSQWKSGVWDRGQALDFLSSHGSGFSRDPALEVAGTIATDPTVIGSVGAAGLAKLGLTGVKVLGAGEGAILREAGTAGRANVLGKAAESQRVNGFLRWYGGHVYQPLEGSAVGKAAKITRTIIDPLHAVGGNRVTSEALMDVQSEATVRAVHDAYGAGNALAALRYVHSVAPDLYEGVSDSIGVYSANVGRNIEASGIQKNILYQGLGEQLVGTLPSDVLSGKVAAKDFAQLVKDEAAKVRVTIWDDLAKQNLGERMASMFGHKAADEYVADFAKMPDDQLAFLHAATYGKATRSFLDAVLKSVPDYTGTVPLKRLVLLNRDSLTDLGANGLLEQLAQELDETTLKSAGFKSPNDFLATLIRQEQAKYPELRYVVIREGEQQADSIDKFERWLKSRLDNGVLPHQVTHDELAKFPQALQDFDAQAHGAWSLGFRPEDDLLWGLEHDLEGNLYNAVSPWVDHVGSGTAKYRPTSALLMNVAGQPILGKVARAIAKPIDYLEAGARTLKGGVTSASITENARSRFVKNVVLGDGMNEQEAQAIFRGVIERAGLNKTTARALSESDMWKAVEDLIPPRLRDTGKFTRRDLAKAVVDAYEGDLRFVGLTQKMTGRAKTLLEPLGGNIVGQIAEGLYPNIKFRFGAVFQMQEKIEPIILNAQRGVTFALGTKLNTADRIAQNILDRMVETGIVRMSDIDQQELSALTLIGRDIEHGLTGIADPSRWEQLANVQGTKRLNMLRTFQHDLGGVVRESMETHQPGLFADIKAAMQANSKYVLSDDEVALRYVAEQALSNEVHVNALVKPGSRAADFEAAISTQEWHAPADLGELRPLNLDFMAKRLAIPVEGGKTLDSIKELRGALASKQTTWDRVEEALLNHNAHPDYVSRVRNALDFHYDPFWAAVKSKYNLGSKDVTRLQNMMSGAARMRGMSPVEFLSQVFSPMVEGGSEATINELGKAVNILRSPMKGGGTPEMLMTQLADVFAAHLDPSGREALLAAFERGLPKDINDLMVAGGKRAAAKSQALQGTLESLRGGWTKDTSRQFARSVLDRMNGVAGPIDADAERAVQQFTKWSKDVLTDGLLTDTPNPFSELLSQVAKLPTDAAAPFNHTQQLMMSTITHQMRLKEEDAFRLHYFARNRSFLQRSINHPFFGIYPASYMWGKIMPELVRFVAKEPFGVRTGAAAYSFRDAQQAIAIQREFDPEFDKQINATGHNQAVWFLGYMLPSLPWDVGAAAPNWMRDLAQQAAENQHRVDQGKQPHAIDYGRTIGKVGDYISPARPFAQINEALKGLGKPPFGPEKGQTPTAPQTVAPHGPLAALELGPVLQDDLSALRELLSRAAGS